MTRIPFILLATSDGSPLTGAAPTVTISKDGAAFTAATNAPHETGNGYYYVDLTTAETTVTNNVIIRATATGAQPTAVVWEPEQDISGLATSQDITNSQTVIIGAMPTTAGLATTSDVTTAQAAIIGAMPDVNNLATKTDLSNAEDTIIGNIVSAMPDISGLSTFDAATDTVTIDATQAAGMATADVSGLATATAQAAQTAAISKLDSSVLHWAATVNTLTLYDSNNATLAEYTLTRDGGGNITAIAPKEQDNV